MSDWYEEMERAEQEYDAKLADEAMAYQDGYQQGKTDAIIEALEPYDAESIEDLAYNAYRKGGKDAIRRMLKRMNTLWKKYEEDPDNVPKPDFMSAVALIAMMEGENNDSQI